MKKTPKGWPRITPSLYYDNPNAGIEWLCRAFGFEVRLKIDGENGRVEHSELSFGDDGLISVGTASPENPDWKKNYTSPQRTGGNTQGLAVFVDDVDAHYAKAKAEGAVIFRELKTDDYGDDYWADRTYGALDCEKHQWFFMQRVRDAAPRGE